MSQPMTVAAEEQGFLYAWHYPQYRLLWISAFGFYIVRWIETVVVSWLILELTNSSFLVGLLGACRFAGMLLGPFCGTVADRFNRRRILLAAQVVYAGTSLIIMILFLTSQLELWHLFVFTLVGGLLYTFDFSARYAAAADIVKSQHLVTAVSLLVVATGSTSIFGSLIGGSLLEIIGASGCFALMTGILLLSLLALLRMKITAPDRPIIPESMWKNLVDGLHYVKNDKTLFALILIAALVNLFVFPYWYTLIPIFAHDILHTEAIGFGLLMAAIGLGAAIGSLTTGSLPNSLNKGRLIIAAIIAWPAFLLIFSASHFFLLSTTLLIFAGAAQGMAMALIQASLLRWSSEEMYGRVTGIRAFAIATLPLGNLLTGAGASLLGAPIVLIISCSASILVTIFIGIWAPELLKRK